MMTNNTKLRGNIWKLLFLPCVMLTAGRSPDLSAAQSVALKFEPRQVVARSFAAITNAPFVTADDATPELVRDEELVLGVVVQGKARAYPINMLTGPRREIINDELGGQAIASTW